MTLATIKSVVKRKAGNEFLFGTLNSSIARVTYVPVIEAKDPFWNKNTAWVSEAWLKK